MKKLDTLLLEISSYVNYDDDVDYEDYDESFNEEDGDEESYQMDRDMLDDGMGGDELDDEYYDYGDFDSEEPDNEKEIIYIEDEDEEEPKDMLYIRTRR